MIKAHLFDVYLGPKVMKKEMTAYNSPMNKTGDDDDLEQMAERGAS
jgi:hypothetical protein